MISQEVIEHGWTLIEDGDLDGARQVYEELLVKAPDEPEVLALGGAVLAASGEPEAALAAFMRASERDTDERTRYLVHAAEVELAALDHPEEAIALCDRVLDETDDEDELIDAVLIKAEALVSLGDRDEDAREVLAELEGCAIDDPMLLCRAGDLHLTVGDVPAAERAYQSAVGLDEECADGYHGLGLVYEAMGDSERQVSAWLRTRELDLTEPEPPWHLDQEEFASVAEAALAELPEEVRGFLANVPMFVEDTPSEDMVRAGLDPRLLGLFAGVPYPDKSNVAGQVPQLDAVHLFQSNLERSCMNREHLLEEIRVTVLHETAHFFGLDDHHLHDMGLA